MNHQIKKRGPVYEVIDHTADIGIRVYWDWEAEGGAARDRQRWRGPLDQLAPGASLYLDRAGAAGPYGGYRIAHRNENQRGMS